MSLKRIALFTVVSLFLLSSSTSCFVQSKSEPKSHTFWFKSKKNPDHPKYTNPGRGRGNSGGKGHGKPPGKRKGHHKK